MFASLDVQLRREQQRFQTLFRRADRQGYGALSVRSVCQSTRRGCLCFVFNLHSLSLCFRGLFSVCLF